VYGERAAQNSHGPYEPTLGSPAKCSPPHSQTDLTNPTTDLPPESARPPTCEIAIASNGRSLSADIGFCPPVAMKDCLLTAIRPLSVIGSRAFANAAYRHPGGHGPFNIRWTLAKARVHAEKQSVFQRSGPGTLPGCTLVRRPAPKSRPGADITPKIATPCSCSLSGNVSR
jgi:hypothetical protein